MERTHQNTRTTYDRINSSNITPGQKKCATRTNPTVWRTTRVYCISYTPTTYITILGAVEFVRPTDPGMFTLTTPKGVMTRTGATQPIPLTAAKIATKKIAHEERKRQYNEW